MVMSSLKSITYNLKPRAKGQVLIEAIVALAILMMAFMGILVLLNTALQLNKTISNNYIGTYLAEEGVEIVKNIIDKNVVQGSPWDTGFPGVGGGAQNYEMQYDDTQLFASSN